jgi:hypothetical protein
MRGEGRDALIFVSSVSYWVMGLGGVGSVGLGSAAWMVPDGMAWDGLGQGVI